jgi:S-adenosylmethionine:diacylglycerol 3-amino-3-carboxypropyl transferase
MNENVPFIWRKNYRNEAALPEKVLENAHEKARQYLSRAVEINKSNQITR